MEQFSGLVDQLAAYEGAPDPLHYTMCFIDGLRDELKAAVLIQQPSDLDTAYVLASLQEEVTTPSQKRDSRRHDFIYPHKQDRLHYLFLLLHDSPGHLMTSMLLKLVVVLMLIVPDLLVSDGHLLKHTVELRACVNIALKNGPAIIVVLTRSS